MTDLELIKDVNADGIKNADFLALTGKVREAYLAGVRQAAGVSARRLRESGTFKRVNVEECGVKFARFQG